MAFTYITLTHTFETAADVAAAGAIDFTPVEPMHNGLTVVQKSVTTTLTAAGLMSQRLAANTDPDTRPTGTTYRVDERITGQTQLTYYIQIPHDQGSPLDLRALAGWQGSTATGGGTVATINGEGPDGTGNVTLSASDVGAQLADADLTGLAGLGDGVPVRASSTWAVASGTRDGTKFLRDDGTWAAAAGGSSYTDEQVDDRVAALIVAGTNITKTYDDTAGTLTLSAATSGASGIPASTVDAKGDLIAGTANDTVARRSVGTDGQALLADSAQTTGLAWGAPAPAAHNHAATEITSGTVATARLGSGTASSTTYLRGDQTWASAPYTDEQAQDATAAAFAAGTHSGVTFTYNDASNSISATVTSGEAATYTGNKTINGRFGVNKTTSTKQPVNLGATLAAGTFSGSTDDKVGIALSSNFTGDFTGDTGSNPGFAWGLNLFATTGSSANDGKGLSNLTGALLEMSIGTPSGTTFPVVRGLQAEAAFFGASAGCTVTQMESMRVSAPKRKDGATAGTATNAYCLFVEDPTAYAVGASNSWALFVEGGVSRFQGRMDVDGTILSFNASLSLQGDYSGTGKIQLTTNNIGFFGVTPVARQTLPASGSVTAANIRTALINLGLCV